MILLDRVKQIENTFTPHQLMKALRRERISHESVAIALGMSAQKFSHYMLGLEKPPEWIESEFNDLIKQMIEQDMWEMDGVNGYSKYESTYYMHEDKY